MQSIITIASLLISSFYTIFLHSNSFLLTVNPINPPEASAQTQAGFIKGTVTDSVTGAGISGITITTNCNQLGTVTTSTGSNGSYTINCGAYAFIGFYNVTETITVPSGMTATASAPSDPQGAVTAGSSTITFTIYSGFHNELDFSGWNFGLAPETSTISGNIFTDANKDGIQNSGESNYATPPSISIKPNSGTITKNADGSYSISGLNAGTYTVSYGGPPSGYRMTSPLNNPPPSFQVTVGTSGCNVNGAPGASCTNGNISNLNFGISNNYPWFQSVCGDFRDDSGITDNLPAGQFGFVAAASCASPGLPFTGNFNASFGSGQATSTTPSQIVGGSTYPEVYAAPDTPLQTGYSALVSKAATAGITPQTLPCTASNCTLSNLTHGLYTVTGPVVLNSYSFSANQDYVILVNGNLTINGPISVPVGSTLLISASGNITVNPTVGATTPTSTASTLDGWYVAGGSFILPTADNCTDKRLNIAGSVVVNATGGGGTFQNKRDLCGSDTTSPTVYFTQRLDMVLNAPQFVDSQQTLSQEVSP